MFQFEYPLELEQYPLLVDIFTLFTFGELFFSLFESSALRTRREAEGATNGVGDANGAGEEIGLNTSMKTKIVDHFAVGLSMTNFWPRAHLAAQTNGHYGMCVILVMSMGRKLSNRVLGMTFGPSLDLVLLASSSTFSFKVARALAI